MSSFPPYLEKLKDAFYSLPSVTPKNAVRLASDFIKLEPGERQRILKEIVDAAGSIKVCKICGNFSTDEICDICADPERSSAVICVVEEVMDIRAIEEAGFSGRYHVLSGRVDPLNKVLPADLNIAALYDRISSGNIKELILATNLNRKGLATARYIYNEVKQKFPEVSVTQPAHGLSEGSEIIYVNPQTLKEAFEERKKFF